MYRLILNLAAISFLLLLVSFQGPCSVPNQCEKLRVLPVNNEYVVLGDSFFNTYPGACQDVVSYLGLRFGVRIPSETAHGSRLTDSYGPDKPISIAEQYAEALASSNNQLTTVFFNGGANDIFSEAEGVCADATSLECENHIEFIVAGFSDLIETMQADGIEKIVYSGNYHLIYGYSVFDEALMNLNDEIEIVCNSTDGVIFVDQADAFADDYSLFLLFDRFHPSIYGSEKLADNMYSAFLEME